jgi:ketosteroid isomerase-like protein
MDKNALLVQKIAMMIDSWNESNVDAVVDLFAEDAVLFDEDAGEVVSGKNGKSKNQLSF